MSIKAKVHSKRVRSDSMGELKDKSVYVARVAKVVKGGKRFSFSAVIVSGDNRGHVGFGQGKAGEVPDAIRKASERAHKSMIKVPMRGSTITHDVIGVFGPTQVVMKPAAPGTGVIAGSVARAVLELAGVKDIRTKVIGSSTANNVLLATFQGLLSLREPEAVAGAKGKTLEELGYKPF